MKREREERQLYPHQQEGVNKILSGWCTSTYSCNGIYHPLRSFLLHDEMGLGKTIQALEALRRLMATDFIRAYPSTPVLVVAPASCLHIWQQEIEKWFSGDFHDVRVFVNNQATVKTLDNLTFNTILITSYTTLRDAFKICILKHLDSGSFSNAELFRLCLLMYPDVSSVLSPRADRIELLKCARNAWKNIQGSIRTKQIAKTEGYDQLARLSFSCLIMDEIHMIKNSSSKTCKAIGFVSARYRLGLSGTPVMNNGFEMITILKFGLGLYDADWNTVQRNPDGPYCRQLLGNVCFGRKKKDIPEISHLIPQRDSSEIEHLVLDWNNAAAKRLYVSIRNTSVTTLSEIKNMRQEIGENRDDFHQRKITHTQHFWVLFQKLRQICLHHFLIDWENTDIPQNIPYSSDTAFVFPVWLQDKCYTVK